MTFNEVMEKVKGLFKAQPEEPEEPVRQLRDKHLESLEREWQYYENQKRKELLEKKLLALKKKQIRERVFGVGAYQKEKETIMDARFEDSGVDINKEEFNLMQQRSIMKAKKLKF
jgi:hypothetical protein